MKITRLSLKNWMNYKHLEIESLHDRMFIIGPNASGKSNLMDVFRFLRDISLPSGIKPAGGGLQKAVTDRGGLKRLRCLNAKRDTEVLIDIQITDENEGKNDTWQYTLGFKGEGKGNNRLVVSQETVIKNNATILTRPSPADKKDPDRLTQTHLELTNANEEFRALAHHFSETTYLHLVPQLLKHANLIGGNTIEHDPFGQGFLQRLAATPVKTRDSRMTRIQRALDAVVPMFEDLRFQKDEISGQPHIEARFKHWRSKGAWQRETQLSDGTLRLIGLLWSLLEGNSVLLLEEPELSLNEEIVRNLPRLIQRIQKSSKFPTRQVFISTHSAALLSDRSIPPEEVIRLKPESEQTVIKPLDPEEKNMIASGLSVGETLLESTNPKKAGQMLPALS